MGSGFVNEETEVVVDTLELGAVESRSFSAFSGNYPFLSAGTFDDPLFGRLMAVGYLKPVLPNISEDVTFRANAEMSMDIRIDQSRVYGDSLANVRYDLVDVGELWRGGSMKIDDRVALGEATIGSFTIGTHTQVSVDLSREWVDSYRNFYENRESNRDSLYRVDFHGLALMARESGKILPINTDESQFVVHNPGGDTLNIGLSTWGYTLERDNVPEFLGQSSLHGTLEQVLKVELDTLNDAGNAQNISRVELVIYEDSLLMESSLDDLSGSATRPDMPRLRLQRVEQGTTPESIDPGSAVAMGHYDPRDQAFHFDLTDFVRGGGLQADGGYEYYVTGPAHGGVIRSSLLFNDKAPYDKRPKLILTSIQTVSN
ncbi:MAG: hypothetical protein U5K31_08665 [Balneolaceae bacterium]|nr:hypothetical protein [Balneolaceae bacterium]